MKEIRIYCDICGKEIHTEIPFKFEGYIDSSVHGWLFTPFDAVCSECRTRLLIKLRETFNETIKELKNERTS